MNRGVTEALAEARRVRKHGDGRKALRIEDEVGDRIKAMIALEKGSEPAGPHYWPDDLRKAAGRFIALTAALAAEPGAVEGDWVADRQMLADAAEDLSLSDGAVRCLCLARQGKITPEIRKWAEDQLSAAAPHQSGESGK